MEKFGKPTGGGFMIAEIKALEAELSAALTREKALQREICTAKAELIFCDAMIPRDRAIFIAKQRGWDCFEGGE